MLHFIQNHLVTRTYRNENFLLIHHLKNRGLPLIAQKLNTFYIGIFL